VKPYNIHTLRYALCFLAAFGLFIHGASPTVSFEDTGELITAASCLGLSHPPGYTWLTLLGALFMRLPTGDPAFRMNVLSAACGAGTVAAVFAFTQALAAGLPGAALRALAASAAAVALVLSRTMWWQSGIAEKYSLSILLTVLTMLAIFRAWRDGHPTSAAVAAFLFGLNLSHHPHGLHLAPVALAVLWRHRRRFSFLVMLVFLASLPMLVRTAVIPIRSGANPVMNWGKPDNFARLRNYLMARQYKGGMFSARSAAEVGNRFVAHTFVYPVLEFGPVLALAAPGLVVLKSAGPGLILGAALTIGANILLTVPYTTPGIDLIAMRTVSTRRYLTSYAILAVLVGLGLAAAARRFPVWAAAGALLLAVPAIVNGGLARRDRNYLAWDFGFNEIAPLPAKSIFICEGDQQAFPLFYMRDGLGFRPDVAVLGQPFLCWEPMYRAYMPHHPELVFPRFVENPGEHMPRLMVANARRGPSFYSPGCTGKKSEEHLVPYGLVFRAYADPREAAAASKRPGRFPALRLRGVIGAEGRYQDPLTNTAIHNYSMAWAYRGAQALERGDPVMADRLLSEAVRLPAESLVRAAALTHLGMAREMRGRDAEALFQQAVDIEQGFSPALLRLARISLARGNPNRARGLLLRAARNPDYLSAGETAELSKLMSQLP